MAPTVMLIGLGSVGGAVLDLLAKEPSVGRIVACDRSEQVGTTRCNVSRLLATVQGHAPHIEFRSLDLLQTHEIHDVVQDVAPDLIHSSASMQTWWLLDLLPPEAAKPLRDAGFGAWLPVNLAPTLSLMESLRQIGYDGITLTAPFPDVVNCALDRLGIAPTCGAGNVEKVATKLRHLIGDQLGRPSSDVDVRVVAHHAFLAPVFGGREEGEEIPPHHVTVKVDGDDVSDKVDLEELLFRPYPLPPGPAWNLFTSGCTIRLIRALLGDTTELVHAPAPGGLPGGYPVLAGSGAVEVAPLEGLTLDEAISLNERSHRFDGVDRIEEDGTVVVTEEAAELFRTTLGYDCLRVHPMEALDRGQELMRRFREYGERHGARFHEHGQDI